MRSIILSIAVLLGMATVAAACPAWQNPGVRSLYTTGQDLWTPNSYSVTAGGGQFLRNCGFNHTGYVISNPDFEVRIDGLESYNRLNIRVSGSCDTVLLVNDARANWYFDDDSGGSLQPSINIFGAASGVYDIWVGTYNPGTCGSTLTLETF